MIKASITFSTERLLYDIANMAYVESHLMADDMEHNRHITADICQDDNIDRTRQLIDLHHAEVAQLLHPWVHSRHGGKTYRLNLCIPRAAAAGTLHYLRHAVHEYLVSSVLADWLAHTHPTKAAVWQTRADAARLSVRIPRAPRRRHLSPF